MEFTRVDVGDYLAQLLAEVFVLDELGLGEYHTLQVVLSQLALGQAGPDVLLVLYQILRSLPQELVG